jgi:hypothetical protein
MIMDWFKCVAGCFALIFGPVAAILLGVGIVASLLVIVGVCVGTGGAGCLALGAIWGPILTALGAFAAAILLMCMYTCTFGGSYGTGGSSDDSSSDTGTSGIVQTRRPIIIRGFMDSTAKAVAIAAGANVIMSML